MLPSGGIIVSRGVKFPAPCHRND